jgi:paraquat-inducible protein A
MSGSLTTSASSATTAREAGLVSCHFCNTLSNLPNNQTTNDEIETGIASEIDSAINIDSELICPCCKSTIHSRIYDSLNRTWALLIAAIILYIPANFLPIMTISYFGDGQPDTIFSGVILLLDAGMWPLALLIFVASIVIPVLKLIILILLLISIQTKAQWHPKDRTKLYRFTEFVGRWSMVDVFVIAILVSLVQFGNTASVAPGLGALSFAAVVILTMFAAHIFDPRLIWDNLPSDYGFDIVDKDDDVSKDNNDNVTIRTVTLSSATLRSLNLDKS